jgi:hypothetical protein
MHDNFVVVDGVTGETAGFNYTTAAERSTAENVIVLRDYAQVSAPACRATASYCSRTASSPDSTPGIRAERDTM